MRKLDRRFQIWIAVKVDRGIPAKVVCFKDKKAAKKREESWRKRMNLDYEDTGVFKVRIPYSFTIIER